MHPTSLTIGQRHFAGRGRQINQEQRLLLDRESVGCLISRDAAVMIHVHLQMQVLSQVSFSERAILLVLPNHLLCMEVSGTVDASKFSFPTAIMLPNFLSRRVVSTRARLKRDIASLKEAKKILK